MDFYRRFCSNFYKNLRKIDDKMILDGNLRKEFACMWNIHIF